MSEQISKASDRLPCITKQQRRMSMRYVFIISMAGVTGAYCTDGGVINLTAIKLGASDFMLGLLNFAIVAPAVLSLAAINTIDRIGKRKNLIKWFFISTIFVIPLIFIPEMRKRNVSNEICLAVLIVSIVMRMSTFYVGMAGWFPLLQDIVPRRVTGKFFGRLRTYWQGVGFIALLFIAWFLGKNGPWWKFQVIFTIGFLAMLIRAAAVIPVTDCKKPDIENTKMPLTVKLKEVLVNKQSRLLIWYIITYNCVAFATIPFVIKVVKGCGFGDGFVMAATAMTCLGAMVSMKFWGKLADKFGNRSIFSISHAGMIIATVLWTGINPGLSGAILVLTLAFVVSFFNSGNGIAQTRYIFHNLPSHKQYYMVIVNTIATFSMAIGPLLAGAFLKMTASVKFDLTGIEIDNYKIFFVLNAVLFLLPHMLRKKLNIYNDVPTASVIAFIIKPLRQSTGPFLALKPRTKKQNKPK